MNFRISRAFNTLSNLFIVRYTYQHMPYLVALLMYAPCCLIHKQQLHMRTPPTKQQMLEVQLKSPLDLVIFS